MFFLFKILAYSLSPKSPLVFEMSFFKTIQGFSFSFNSLFVFLLLLFLFLFLFYLFLRVFTFFYLFISKPSF